MSADARKLTVTEDQCGVCDTEMVVVFHQSFPELRISGPSAEQAAGQLANRLEGSLEAVADPAHREPVRQAIADVRAFLEREGAPHPARDS
jgi:hypothetical protein